MNKEKNKRNLDYISFASVISAIAVVFLHTNGCFWQFSSTEMYWKTANIIESVFYFAVPVFFMISGATLLDFNKRYGLKEYFLKRVNKVVLPYIIWSVLGLFFQVVVLKSIPFESISVKYMINGLLSGSLVGVYWFFIPLFGVYLSIPLFAAVAEESRKKVFTYLAIICFVMNTLIPFIIKIFDLGVTYSMSVVVGSGYLFYIIVGYLLSRYDMAKKWQYLIYILALVGLLVHIIGTYQLSISAGSIIDTYKGYINVPCIVYSVGIFVFFKYIGGSLMKVEFIAKAVKILAKYTFGIYLMHWYIQQIVVRLFDINTKLTVYRLLGPFLIIAIAVIVIWGIRKIPVVRKILP